MARKKRRRLDPSKFTFTVQFVPPPAGSELRLPNTTSPDIEQLAAATLDDLLRNTSAGERDGSAPVTPSPPPGAKPKKRRRLPSKFTVRLVAPGTYPDLEPNPDNPYTMLPDETRMRLLIEDLAKLWQGAASD